MVKNEKIIKLVGSEYGIKLINSGYEADSYLLLSPYSGHLFLKIFHEKKPAENEIKKLKHLATIESNVVIPKIVKVASPMLFIEYYHGIGFYKKIILSNFSNKHKNELFKNIEDFGEFLSLLHNSRENDEHVIHGDLNSKNFIFCKDKLVILDPKNRTGDKYTDIADFLFNLYPVNVVLNIFLYRFREKIIYSFAKEYEKNAKVAMQSKDINNALLKRMQDDLIYKSKNLLYIIKKIFFNIYLNIMIKKIKNGKLQIKLYK